MFGLIQLNAQKKFDLDVESSTLDLDGKSLTGYSSSFDFTREETRNGWWKYARQFGSPLDMRTYYRVKIPSETTDGNVDLVIFTQAIEQNGQTVFSMGIEEEKYKIQVEELLKVFKREFYIQYYLDQLKLKENEATNYSEQYADTSITDEKDKILTQLNTAREAVERLKEEIRKVEEL